MNWPFGVGLEQLRRFGEGRAGASPTSSLFIRHRRLLMHRLEQARPAAVVRGSGEVLGPQDCSHVLSALPLPTPPGRQAARRRGFGAWHSVALAALNELSPYARGAASHRPSRGFRITRGARRGGVGQGGAGRGGARHCLWGATRVRVTARSRAVGPGPATWAAQACAACNGWPRSQQCLQQVLLVFRGLRGGMGIAPRRTPPAPSSPSSTPL